MQHNLTQCNADGDGDGETYFAKSCVVSDGLSSLHAVCAFRNLVPEASQLFVYLLRKKTKEYSLPGREMAAYPLPNYISTRSSRPRSGSCGSGRAALLSLAQCPLGP